MNRAQDQYTRRALCTSCRKAVKLINPENGRPLPIKLTQEEAEETFARVTPGVTLRLRCNECAPDPHYNTWLISLWLVGKIFKLGPEGNNALPLYNGSSIQQARPL